LNDNNLIEHRKFILENNLGFGENPFHAMWRDLIRMMPKSFKFIEIGVYKGQILSLIKYLSTIENKNVNFIGVTPLSNMGDKFGKYDACDYLQKIKSIFKHFDLDFDENKNLIIGSSTDSYVKKEIIDEKNYDLVYVDGGHDYDTVVSDILLVKEITKINSIIVFDDSACSKDLPPYLFRGHIDVCNAVRDYIENDNRFKEILCVGHNRVFKRITK
jgi:hypothetical protein